MREAVLRIQRARELPIMRQVSCSQYGHAESLPSRTVHGTCHSVPDTARHVPCTVWRAEGAVDALADLRRHSVVEAGAGLVRGALDLDHLEHVASAEGQGQQDHARLRRINDNHSREGASAAAAPWQMAAYDLASRAGQRFEVTLRGQDISAEAWVLADVPTGDEPPAGIETPLSFRGHWRETVGVLAGPVAPPRRATPAEIASATAARIELEVFGNAAGQYGDKTLFLGEMKLGTLPPCGDAWQVARFELEPAARAALRPDNTAVIRGRDPTDKFKVQRIRIVLTLPDGSELAGPATGSFVSDADWAHAAGAEPFAAGDDSGPIPLPL